MKKNDDKLENLLNDMKVIKSKDKCRNLSNRLYNYYSLNPIEQAMLIGEVIALLDDLC